MNLKQLLFFTGELSARARHSLDYLDTVPYFSLPDEINQVADDLLV